MLNNGSKLGPYEILSPLGAGGMGEVYKARDTRLERTVAIKVLPAHLSSNPDLKQRFEREAKAISALQHGNICTLYDVGHQNGTDYLVMEYLEGESLADRLSKGALPLKQALEYGVQIADALEKAHRAGIVHRDLKPANIMLTKSGAKLLDFGLAKPASSMAAAASLTMATAAKPLTAEGTIVGTYQYMAPEQVQGQEADARSDIFALGAVLYEMATGKRAFPGKTQISVMSAILEREPEPITAVQPMSPPALDHVIRTCLAKDPDERFQTAHDIRVQLKWISEGGSQVAPAIAVARRKRLRWLPWAIAAVLAGVGAATGWYLRARQPEPVLRATLSLPSDTLMGDADSAVALSPDGRRVAITLRKDGKTMIWLRAFDSRTAQPLAGTDGGTYPTWSPDGKSLAFFAERKIKRIDLASGMVQAVCDADDGRGLAWGSDDTIVFSPGPFAGLYSVPAGGGTPAQLTQPDAAGDTHRLPVFLPGGKQVLFFDGSPNNSRNGLDVVTLATRQVTHILDVNSGARYVLPGYLLYVKDGSLVAQQFDASALKLSGNPAPVADQVQFTPFRWTGPFDASADGSLVYGDQPGGGKYEWSWLDRDGKLLKKLGEPTTTGLIQSSISPDDKRIATTRDLAIWLYDLDRGVATRLTFENGAQVSPVWSPDGKTIIYSGISGPGNWTVSMKPADGGGAAEVVLNTPLQSGPTSWSPDGKFVALTVSNAGPTRKDEIWILPLTGDRKPYPFLQANGRLSNGQFSPDGHWMLYLSDESGRVEAYLVPFPEHGGKWQVSSDGAQSARWLTNNEIVYISGGNKAVGASIKTAPNSVEIGSPHQLLTQADIVNANGAAWAHDGKRVLVAVPVGGTAAPQLNLVAHWTATLKK